MLESGRGMVYVWPVILEPDLRGEQTRERRGTCRDADADADDDDEDDDEDIDIPCVAAQSRVLVHEPR